MVDAERPDSADAIQALTRAYIACNLAQDALSDLPSDVRDAVEGAVKTLCAVVGPEIERLESMHQHRA